MRWFGEPWGAPVNEECGRADVPVGQWCEKCEEPIAEGERGVLVPEQKFGGSIERPWHLACFVESLTGPGFSLALKLHLDYQDTHRPSEL